MNIFRRKLDPRVKGRGSGKTVSRVELQRVGSWLWHIIFSNSYLVPILANPIEASRLGARPKYWVKYM